MNRMNAFALALVAALLTATAAYADGFPPRDDTQAPRGAQVQGDRGSNEDVQAPRG
jgi:hypothetical protein